jgi:hypothetical protein
MANTQGQNTQLCTQRTTIYGNIVVFWPNDLCIFLIVSFRLTPHSHLKIVKCVLVRSPVTAYDMYGVFCLWSEEDIFFPPPLTLLSICLGPGLLPCDMFVCPRAYDHKIVIFVPCQSDIYFRFLENLRIKLPRYWNGFHRTSRRFSSILLQWLNIIYYIKQQAVNLLVW